MTMKLTLLTREYPPTIYGGAGVHLAQPVPQPRKLLDGTRMAALGWAPRIGLETGIQSTYEQSRGLLD